MIRIYLNYRQDEEGRGGRGEARRGEDSAYLIRARSRGIEPRCNSAGGVISITQDWGSIHAAWATGMRLKRLDDD